MLPMSRPDSPPSHSCYWCLSLLKVLSPVLSGTANPTDPKGSPDIFVRKVLTLSKIFSSRFTDEKQLHISPEYLFTVSDSCGLCHSSQGTYLFFRSVPESFAF